MPDFNAILSDEINSTMGHLTIDNMGLRIQLDMVGRQLADIQRQFAEMKEKYEPPPPPETDKAPEPMAVSKGAA